MQYSIIDHSDHAVYRTPKAYIFCNRKFVSVDPLHPFHHHYAPHTHTFPVFLLLEWSWSSFHMRCVLSCFSPVWLFATLWTAQAALSMGFSRQEYWSALPFSSPGDFSQPRDWTCISCLLHWQAGSLPLAPPGKPIFSYG